METCKTCKYWIISEEDRADNIISPYDPVTYCREKAEEAISVKWGHNVRYCRHPKLEFYQRPDKDGLAVVDGSERYAALLTGEDFGCILHEAVLIKTKKFSELQVGDRIKLNPRICSVNPNRLVQEVIKAPEKLGLEASATWCVWLEEFGRYYGDADSLIDIDVEVIEKPKTEIEPAPPNLLKGDRPLYYQKDL